MVASAPAGGLLILGTPKKRTIAYLETELALRTLRAQ